MDWATKKCPKRWRNCGGGWAGPILCDWGSRFCCRICRKDVSVKTHGVHGILRHFQVTKHFPKDQSLCLETAGWRVLDFEGSPLGKKELERQGERILRAPQVVSDREYPFSVDLIVDSSGTVDVSLPVFAKVSALIGELCSGWSYELVHQLWSEFTLDAERVNVDFTSSRDEVLISRSLVPDFKYSSWLFSVVLLSANHPERIGLPYLEHGLRLG